jgi:tetratricopeptide (TPR) repeat protein
VVEPAAVIGLVFAGAAIAYLVPDALKPSVERHLSELDHKQFVHPIEAGDDEAYRFHHILVRDAAYQSLLKRARATLHERFVDWAEPVNRERGRETEFEEILGYHLEQAVRYRSELGPLDDQGRLLAGRAAGKLSSAGRRAFARGDTPAACNLLRRATALLSTDDPVRLELLGDLADALVEEGQFDEARDVLADGRAVAERLEDARLLARIRIADGVLSLALSDLDKSDASIEEARQDIAALSKAGDEAGLARGWRHLFFLSGTRGDLDEASEAAKHVVEHARLAGDSRLASRGAIGYASAALWGPTPVTEALATCERLVREVEGDRKAESLILGVLGQLRAMRGDFDAARELYRRAASMLADLGPSLTSSTLSIEASRVEALAGDYTAAERALRKDDEALGAMGERNYRSTIDALLGEVLATLGQFDDAQRFSELAEELAAEDDIWGQVHWRQGRARAYAGTGRFAEAEALSREAVELARGTVDIATLGGALVDLAEVLTLAGRQDETEPPLREALSLYERKEDLVSVARVRGLLTEPAEV